LSFYFIATPPPKRRGPKDGQPRGTYAKRARESVRRRICDSAREGGDWRIVAENNGVKVDTARNWIKKGTPTLLKVGGSHNTIIQEDHRDSLMEWLSINPELSLKELTDMLDGSFDIQVCHQTVSNHLDGMLFTLKRTHYEPITMNNEEKKTKRRQYVQSLLAIMQQEDSVVVYIDETNLNLFTRREYGRSAVGKRVVSRLPASKGPNIHIIGAISQNGLEYWEKRRGNYKKEEASNFVQRLIRTLVGNGTLLENIVVVCDNAPCHSNIEALLTIPEFNAARILRLGPYSPQLNPIEAVWSFTKDKFKSLHASRKKDMMAGVGQNDLTQTEYRVRYIENIIDDIMPTITRNKCIACFNHVQGLYPRVMAMEDLQCGV
jgi:transposase